MQQDEFSLFNELLQHMYQKQRTLYEKIINSLSEDIIEIYNKIKDWKKIPIELNMKIRKILHIKRNTNNY
jgi:hypothetical protein